MVHDQISIVNSIRVDDCTFELAIIASNVPDEQQRWMVNFSLVSCIYHWIGNKRCKRGERVLKQPTVWISIIKITN